MQLNSSLLTLSVIAVLVPAAFHVVVQPANRPDPTTDAQEGHDILPVSHGIAIILLFTIYICYFVFEFESTSKNVGYTPSGLGDSNNHTMDPEKAWGTDVPPIELWKVILLLVVATCHTLTTFCLIGSIDDLTQSGHISKGFVGLVLLPTAAHTAGHVVAVAAKEFTKDKLTESFNVAVDSSIQIALFVILLMVTLGWILGKQFTLLFDPLESIVLFLSVLTVNYTVQDNMSNWLEGMTLMSLYAIIAVTFWYYPVSGLAGVIPTCP